MCLSQKNLSDLLLYKYKRGSVGGLSKTVLVCAAAGNSELILLFSYYIFFREKKSIMHTEYL